MSDNNADEEGVITIKRDMDLIRKILLYLEEDQNPLEWRIIEVDGKTLEEVSYQVKLLSQAGLIEGKDATRGPYHFRWLARSLTHKGHDFLDSLRNETVYKRMKEKLGEQISGIPLMVISSVGADMTKEWVKQKIGLK
ncbi:DUF2513 domain-containing protein [Bacillus pumilus]|uniref:DUF2513 domain-containing protein n=1 Tax=Bacillus pumilus TaxID=1408 RepID=UPI000D033EC0|nr:DUF2513 domain-containing protein [Bacillus pumilus]PRS65045.1 hypothetical protein C6X97_01330 [Bacillus pumilus]